MALDTSTALVVGKVVSVGCIGIFAGQSLFYNAILMPALRRAHTDAALPVWANSYQIAKGKLSSLTVLHTEIKKPRTHTALSVIFHDISDLQVALVGASLLSGFGVYYKTENIQHLIPPVLLATVVPFTFAFIMPINRELLDILNGTGKKNSTVEHLLNRWDMLHFGRTVLSIAAFVLALYDTYSDNAAIRF
ncbi:hypothetical protein BG006_005925 [Podila minutissima]|uniref:Uncharacterized protein n=1 Tax=Podila minutissima TaxID=64525 RepID=A0A9P5SVF9_9FUNG|nr:hypothetical protein BG006_005925 [Podila minutissima]